MRVCCLLHALRTAVNCCIQARVVSLPVSLCFLPSSTLSTSISPLGSPLGSPNVPRNLSRCLSHVSVCLSAGLVLAPTIELATQIADVMRDFGAVMGATVHLCVGGTKVAEDKAALRAGVHVVVGTLGRVVQLVELNALQQSRLRVLVLDEADEMLKSDKVS